MCPLKILRLSPRPNIYLVPLPLFSRHSLYTIVVCETNLRIVYMVIFIFLYFMCSSIPHWAYSFYSGMCLLHGDCNC